MRQDGRRAEGRQITLPIRATAWILTWIVRAWISTLRVNVIGPEPPGDRPLIFAFLHGRQMGLLRYPRPARVVVMTSLSRDGMLQARLMRALGFEVVRGSSSRRGAEGLVTLIRQVRRGASAAIAVDGPKGPARCVKPGVALVAQAAEA